ncbi:hypothetical protein RMATCC62417_18660 [Rhizopus microsporus]|nr:hypothetical protein RMATCC62417_18660 [Rhizopus microsporus]
MESLLVNLNKKKRDGKTIGIDDYDITNNQEEEEDEEYEEYEEEEEERSDREYSGQTACEQLFQKSPDMDAVEQQMSGLTIKDYQRTRYFGASAGIHLLEKNVLFRNKKLHFKSEPSWFIQKVNDDEEEHVIVKSEEIYQPQQINVVKGPLPTRIKLFEDVPLMTPELLDLFVYLYFTQVHIYGPLINKVEFLEQYYFQNPSAPDEYLLYAIAYIGSQLFTPKESEMAESDMVQIKECLKDKAFQILGIAYKRPYVSTVQSLLVLTSHVIDDQDADDEDTGHWIIAGLAIRLAQDLGLHIDCSQWKIPPYEIELRRRIWYTCYFVDRWIGAQLGRPLSIIDDDFDVILPTPYELETKVARTRSEITPILLVEADAALQQRLPVYNHFSYLVTLTHILGQVLIGQYSTLNKRNRSVEFVNCMEQNLHMWRQSLPKEMFSVHDKHHAPQYSLMQLVYYTVIIFIYRPFISTTAENKELAFKALGICTSAANSLMNAALSVDNCSLANAPWNLTV